MGIESGIYTHEYFFLIILLMNCRIREKTLHLFVPCRVCIYIIQNSRDEQGSFTDFKVIIIDLNGDRSLVKICFIHVDDTACLVFLI